jgi:positive regulator of sigma E activity
METIAISLASILVISLAKKLGIDQKVASLIVVVILALGYTVAKHYLPREIQGEIVTIVTGTVGTAKILYDVITSINKQ